MTRIELLFVALPMSLDTIAFIRASLLPIQTVKSESRVTVIVHNGLNPTQLIFVMTKFFSLRHTKSTFLRRRHFLTSK